jgi:ribosome-associated protein
VVHVQHAEERAYYALERLGKDCPTIPFVDNAGAKRDTTSEGNATADGNASSDGATAGR